VPFFRQAQQLAPLSNTAIHSTYFEAISLFRLERWAEAEGVFRRLLANFPEAQAAAESSYHIGICRARQRDPEGAARAGRTRRAATRTRRGRAFAGAARGGGGGGRGG
jgi:TolA-binding protein